MSEEKDEPIPSTDPEVIKRMGEELIENRHYEAIGRVVVNWSFLESTVDTWSMNLTKISVRQGLCFTAQISGIGRKLDAFIALARLRKLPENLVKELEKFSQSAQGQAERRNRIVHDSWFFAHPALPHRLEITARRKLIVREHPTSTEELMKFANEIYDIQEKFESFANKVIAASPQASSKTNALASDQTPDSDHPPHDTPP